MIGQSEINIKDNYDLNNFSLNILLLGDCLRV